MGWSSSEMGSVNRGKPPKMTIIFMVGAFIKVLGVADGVVMECEGRGPAVVMDSHSSRSINALVTFSEQSPQQLPPRSAASVGGSAARRWQAGVLLLLGDAT